MTSIQRRSIRQSHHSEHIIASFPKVFLSRLSMLSASIFLSSPLEYILTNQTTPDPTRSRSSRPQVESWLPNTSRSKLLRSSVVTVAANCQVSLLWDQDNTLKFPRPTRPCKELTAVLDVPTVSRRELSEPSWLRNKRLSRECWRTSKRRRRRLLRTKLPCCTLSLIANTHICILGCSRRGTSTVGVEAGSMKDYQQLSKSRQNHHTIRMCSNASLSRCKDLDLWSFRCFWRFR